MSTTEKLVEMLRDCPPLRSVVDGGADLDAISLYMQEAYSLRHEAADTLEAQAARIAELEEALEPFADVAESLVFIRADPDQVFIWSESGGDRPKSISVAQVRRAASARGKP